MCCASLPCAAAARSHDLAPGLALDGAPRLDPSDACAVLDIVRARFCAAEASGRPLCLRSAMCVVPAGLPPDPPAAVCSTLILDDDGALGAPPVPGRNNVQRRARSTSLVLRCAMCTNCTSTLPPPHRGRPTGALTSQLVR